MAVQATGDRAHPPSRPVADARNAVELRNADMTFRSTMDDCYVTIIDRKKELIINAVGKNMSPRTSSRPSRPRTRSSARPS